uniref:Uncharacterized protein n=1 Tax=Neogobius melanostomus TaxID=47308 RepID=A0A8C6TBD5_9GOBI
MVLFGPLLSLWVSKYNIFANKNTSCFPQEVLRSAWGWTCIFTGSFIVVLSLSAWCSMHLCLRHLSRLLVAGLLWWGFRRLLTLLEDATGTCYEPMSHGGEVSGSSAQPLLLLHEDQTKVSPGRVHSLHCGSHEAYILENKCIFRDQLARRSKSQTESPAGAIRCGSIFPSSVLCPWDCGLFLAVVFAGRFYPELPAQRVRGRCRVPVTWRDCSQGWYRPQGRWFCPGCLGETCWPLTMNKM